MGDFKQLFQCWWYPDSVNTMTEHPGLPESDLVFTWCPELAVNSNDPFIRKCSGLDDKDRIDLPNKI